MGDLAKNNDKNHLKTTWPNVMRLYRDIDNKLSRIRRWIAEGINTLTSSKWSMNTKHDLPLFNKGTIIFLQQMLNAIKFRPPVDQTFGLLCPCAITACFFLHWCIYSKIPCHTRKELTHGSNLDQGLALWSRPWSAIFVWIKLKSLKVCSRQEHKDTTLHLNNSATYI